MLEIIEIPYRPRWPFFALLALVCAVASLICWFETQQTLAPVVVFHVLPVSAAQLALFYRVGLAIFVPGLVLCALVVYYSRRSQKVLRLDETTLAVPIRTFSDKPVEVKLHHIERLQLIDFQVPEPPAWVKRWSHNPLVAIERDKSNRMLVIHYSGKRRLAVVERMLPSSEWFDYFCAKLVEKSEKAID